MMTVRLGSGVELTLLGPASLEVANVLEVRLESGRLLANVPHWATGFTVHAPGLTAWATNNPPAYCVVDLAGGYATNAWPVTYHVSAEALPDGGLTNPVYRTTRLAMRRIPATGPAGFDLPTEAQWEYTCRAGTSGALNVPLPDGSNLTNANGAANMDLAGRYQRNGGQILVGSAWTNPDSALGVSASAVTADYATAKAGSYLPNAWGLYDTHGNVWEWCLDWKGTDGHLGTADAVDPVGRSGTAAGSSRVRRGASWGYDTASSCRSAYRSNYAPSYRSNVIGFRLVRTLP